MTTKSKTASYANALEVYEKPYSNSLFPMINLNWDLDTVNHTNLLDQSSSVVEWESSQKAKMDQERYISMDFSTRQRLKMGSQNQIICSAAILEWKKDRTAYLPQWI